CRQTRSILPSSYGDKSACSQHVVPADRPTLVSADDLRRKSAPLELRAAAVREIPAVEPSQVDEHEGPSEQPSADADGRALQPARRVQNPAHERAEANW